MNRIIIIAIVLTMGVADIVPAQQQSLASSLNIYVFPKAGQVPEQQSQDESSCYQWAVSNTGVDPFELSKQTEQKKQQVQQQEQQVNQATQGAGAKGAVGGAAAGALIGEIGNDDAGQGAAYGAAAGAIMGRRKAKSTQDQAAQQSQQQMQQIEQEAAQARGNFNNAFSVCLEGMDYLVKF